MTELTPAERAAYPEPSIRDLACVIRRARDTVGDSRHVCGRYTAFRVVDASDSVSGERTVIRVWSCEREILCDVPLDVADEMLTVLTAGVSSQSGGA